MGYVPYVPKLPMYEWDEATLRHEMRHRDSRFASRRHRAYAACLELIRRAEEELGYTRERSNELLRGMHDAFYDLYLSRSGAAARTFPVAKGRITERTLQTFQTFDTPRDPDYPWPLPG